MNPLIDKNMVEVIRSTGKARDDIPDRVDILDKFDLPYDRPAENLIITGCQMLGYLTRALNDFTAILEQSEVTYTFLSKEYCCGAGLYRPAIDNEDDEALSECHSLSREFGNMNFEKARELGVKRIITFCAACYMIYRHVLPDENIIFYPQAIDELMPELEWQGSIDYYGGCYKQHRQGAPVRMDLKSTNSVFKKIKGLTINRISSKDCCYTSVGLDHMVNSAKTKYMVHICTGCYFKARHNIPRNDGVKVLMLPEFIHMLMRVDQGMEPDASDIKT